MKAWVEKKYLYPWLHFTELYNLNWIMKYSFDFVWSVSIFILFFGLDYFVLTRMFEDNIS